MPTTWTPRYSDPVADFARAVRSTDTTNLVTWTSEATGEDFQSALLPHDALALAKDLVFNPGYAAVQLTTTSGRVLDAAAIQAAKF